MFNLVSGRIVAAIKKSTENGLKLVRLNIQEIFGSGSLTNIDILTQYGTGNIPPDNNNIYMTSVNNSEKCLFALGSVNAIPNIYREPVQGESWNYSQKYVLVYQNDGINAYRQAATPDFYCTLPNGQAFVQMMIDRVTELENMITAINNNYTTLKSAFDAHVHSGIVTGGGTSGAPTSSLSQTNIPTYATLAKDKTYLTDGKALINDLGEVYT